MAVAATKAVAAEVDSAAAAVAVAVDTVAAAEEAKALDAATGASNRTASRNKELSSTNLAQKAGFFYSSTFSKVSTTFNSPVVTSPGPAKVLTLPKSPSKFVPK